MTILFEVLILGAIIIDIICKFISVKECNDILHRCKDCVDYVSKSIGVAADAKRQCIEAKEDTVHIVRAAANTVDATEAIVKALAKDQHDIWEQLLATGDAVSMLNKRLSPPVTDAVNIDISEDTEDYGDS